MDRPESAEFVTVPEATRRSGIGRRQFLGAIGHGDLEVFDVGGWPRVRWRDVLAWVESKQRPVGEPRSDALQRRVADQ